MRCSNIDSSFKIALVCDGEGFGVLLYKDLLFSNEVGPWTLAQQDFQMEAKTIARV